MFFSGHTATQGVCPAGGAHEGHGENPVSFNFTLAHNVPPGTDDQADWRNCWKCQVMFFDGYPKKGVCPAGGTHEGHGDDPRTWTFVLPHPLSPSLKLQKGIDVLSVTGLGFTQESDAVYGYSFVDGQTGQTVSNPSPVHVHTDANGAFVSMFATAQFAQSFFVEARDLVSGHGTVANLVGF